MKEIKKTDNKERKLELVFKKLRALSTKASTVLVESMCGQEDGYTKKQIYAAKCLLQTVDPQRVTTPLGIRDSAFDLL